MVTKVYCDGCDEVITNIRDKWDMTHIHLNSKKHACNECAGKIFNGGNNNGSIRKPELRKQSVYSQSLLYDNSDI